ncbi:type II toxin-antitoxin system VapC family toxin [Rhizobium sp. SL42]|uniref:type II toxin-antitoxin system VapC family toxin n=1 Tax=Rhizobium sp. SL42 TaxID=2806346 RepID=UPI001F2FDE29|nr:type II toxin-antitoxin system VapC family toxin [Rhizobium sp. SL42]UJW75739.1 type II toxin-antitoxin system VapC family toxin [Rhizobium sp. SL42]
MIAIDTNLVIRYLTNDHPEQADRARAVIDRETVFVPVTVMLEAEWVLRGAYGYTRSEIAGALRAFGGLLNVTLEEEATVAAALDLMERGMDFADALHLGKSAHCDEFLTFDQKLVKAAKAIGHDSVREA